MRVLTLRQSELADESFPLATIRRVLKHAGFDLNRDIARNDNFFMDSVTFLQADNEDAKKITSCRILDKQYVQAEESCTS